MASSAVSIPRLSPDDFRELLCSQGRRWTELYLFGPSPFPDDHRAFEHIVDFFGPCADVACIFYLREGYHLIHLSKVKTLRSLALVGFGVLRNIGDLLKHLTQLRHLDLEESRIGADDVLSLTSHKTLHSLNLTHSSIGDEGLSHIKHLKRLNKLRLWNNQIETEGAIHLKELKTLKELNLGGNNIGDVGTTYLKGLTGLESLTLSHNGLSASGVSSLARLKNLRFLDLRHNQITDAGVRHLTGFRRLTTLVLMDNPIGDIGVRQLADSYNGTIPGCLETLDLTLCCVDSVDYGLLETCNAKEIFGALQRGVSLPQARLMLVGMGNVGKSFLAERTFRKQRPLIDRFEHKETADIVVLRPEDCKQWKPIVKAAGERKQVEPWVWDFSGQLVTHGLHESFLADDGRTVYLLVLAADYSLGSSSKESHGNRLVYWLQLLRHTIGRAAPVIIVITRCDRVRGQKPQVDAAIAWPELAEHCSLRQLWKSHRNYFSEKLGVTVVELVGDFSACDVKYQIDNGLRQVISRAIEQLGVADRKKVHPKLEILKNRVDSGFRYRTMISTNEFFTWCSEEKITKKSTQKALLLNLHHLGSLVFWGQFESSAAAYSSRAGYRSDRSAGRRSSDYSLMTQVMNPEWFKQCVYQITRKSEELVNGKPRTWLTCNEIDREIRKVTKRVTNHPDVTLLEKAVIRNALEFAMVCFLQGGQYVFPRGLPKLSLSPFAEWERWELIWDFLPEYCVARLIVALHSARRVVSEEKDQYIHGCNAALIHYPEESGIQALVVADPDHGRVEVRFPKESQREQQSTVVDYVSTLLSSEEMQNRPPDIKRPIVVNMRPRSVTSETEKHSVTPAEGAFQLRDVLNQLDGAVQRDFLSYWIMVCSDGPCDAGSGFTAVHSQMMKLLRDNNPTDYLTTRDRLLKHFSNHPPRGSSHKVKLESGIVVQVPMEGAWRRNLNHAVENFTGNASALEFLEGIGLGTQHGKRVKRHSKPRYTWRYPDEPLGISQK